MKIKPSSFKTKLTLSYILLIVISFSFVGYFLNKSLEENALKDIESNLIKNAYLIENQIEVTDLKKENTDYLDSLSKKLSQIIKSRITIIDMQGKVLADSEIPRQDFANITNHSGRPEIRTAFSGEIGREVRYSATIKMDMLYIALPLKDKQEVKGVLRLAIPLEVVNLMLHAIRKAVFFSLVFALGLAYMLGSLLARAIFKPINRISHISRKFAAGDFSHKIYLNSKDEIGELAAVLNKMSENLEEKIHEVEIQNQQLKAILESMVEGIIVVNKDSRIVSVNRAIEQIFSIKKAGIEGKIFLEVIRNTDIAEIINQVLNKGNFFSQELTLIWPVQRIFQVNASAIWKQKAIEGCLLVIHDITQLRKLEAIRRDFVANVSHELKTPLTSIKGFVETLLDGALDDKANNRNFIKIIQEHTERLNKLVDDLLSLSHLESQEITLEKTSFSLKEQLEKVILGFKAQLKNKNIEIKDELVTDILVMADKDRVEQVLANLIDNAIKFNHENGFIKIYSQETNEKTKIIVEDSGIGIPEKDIPRIFERFYRVDKARSRELGGTGLGLSIVKHIVELHSGSVGVESTEGFGSKFWFTLPK
ncbi:MAG: ATP-binding protein [Candidatus Omnitrophota bacterium]|nr:ATP-binding protein [Candidatus Omnitrophota bacterium]